MPLWRFSTLNIFRRQARISCRQWLRLSPWGLCSIFSRCSTTLPQSDVQASECRFPTSSISSITFSQSTASKSRRRSAAACSRDQVHTSSQ